MTRATLGRIAALAFAIVALAGAALLMRACAPSAVIESRRATEVRADEDAWQKAVSTLQRQRALMALAALLGTAAIIASFVRSTRRNASDLSARRIAFGRALFRALAQGTLGLVGAVAILIIVPSLEWLAYGDPGMYAGDRGVAAAFTLAWFLCVWVAATVPACAHLWRRTQALER